MGQGADEVGKQVGLDQVGSSQKGSGWAQRPVSTARLGPIANEVRHKAQKQNGESRIMQDKPDVK